MPNTLDDRFQFFLYKHDFCTTQFSDTQVVYNSMLNLYYSISKNMCCVSWLRNNNRKFATNTYYWNKTIEN